MSMYWRNSTGEKRAEEVVTEEVVTEEMFH